MSDMIGERGEKAFERAITDYQQFKHPLFRPRSLGEKWPTIDFYVELLGLRTATPFFFAQVKSTTANLAKKATALPVRADKINCERMYRLPGPTYVVGVHEPSERAFILSLHTKPQKGVYQIPLKHELTPSNLKILHNEVATFWKSHPRKPSGSYFT